jgi:hypothetical protein
LAALAESEAKAEAGLFVSGDEIMRELQESIARMERRATDHQAVIEQRCADQGSPHDRSKIVR